jgi:AcrR family transcriptional regulator
VSTPDTGHAADEKSAGRARVSGNEDTVVALADMTSNQLIRRARILEEVLQLIAEVGADAVQMRDVAQRSGVALATVYRYFSSKDHLLAVALEDWQKRLTRRINASGGKTPAQPLPGVLDYLRRALRAFHRNPEMTALMLKTATSTDPYSTTTIEHMNRNNVELFGRLLDGVAPEAIPFITFGLNAALSSALAALLTDKLSFDESLGRVEWVAHALLTDRC